MNVNKILYLPIFEPGGIHEIAVRNKRGLFDALINRGCQVFEFDYLACTEGLATRGREIIEGFQPDLLLTQLHGHEPVTVDMMQHWRQIRPEMHVVNWSGDSWRHSLVGEKYLPLVRQFDLQLTAAPDIIDEYAALGIRAAYWQIAYERPVGELPEMPWYDVVFLGNTITGERRAMMERLKALDGVKVGIYGDWEQADGYNCYDFGQGEALYKHAKVAIADNVYPDQQNYVSNRPIQILMAGGATLLHQRVPKMPDLLGIKPGVHYIVWHDLDDLMFKMQYWLQQYDTGIQQAMVTRGRKYAQAHHTYACRVAQLFDELLPMIAGVGV